MNERSIPTSTVDGTDRSAARQGGHGMTTTHPLEATANPIAASRGRQILFYAPNAVPEDAFTCSRCGATASHPKLIRHADDCSYRPADADLSAFFRTP